MQKISVVVPVYKVPFEFLDQCIKSIVNQTYNNFEVIIVDDGSPDEWADKCDSYSEEDSRIRVIHKKNGGLSDARNKGLEEAKAEWITFIDGDDWIEKNFFELFINKLSEQSDTADIYMYSGFRNYPEKQVEGVPHFQDGTRFVTYQERENLQTKCFTNHIAVGGNIKGITISSGCMKMFRVDFLRNNKLLFPIVPYDEDSLFYLDSIEKATAIEYCSVPVYHYRFTNGSIVNQYRPNAVKEQEQYLGYIFDFIKENNKSQDFTDKAYMRVMTSMLLLIKQKFFNPENQDSYFKRQVECTKLFRHEPYFTVFRKLNMSQMRRNAKIKLLFLRLHLYGFVEQGRRINQKKVISAN